MAEQLCRAGVNLSLLDKVIMATDTYQYCNIDKLLCLQKKKSVYDIAKSYSPTIHKMLLNVMSHSLHFLNYFCMYAWSQLPKKESKGADLGSCDEGEVKDGDQPASATRQDKNVSIVSSYT